MSGNHSRNKGWAWLRWLPDYIIYENGEIKRIRDGVTRKRGFRPKGHICNGYKRFKLTLSGKKVSLLAHRLVCEAFHGPAPEGRILVAHNDGDPLNNHYSNLRWATCKENLDDRKEHGTELRGERNGRAKLTVRDVNLIRMIYVGRYGQIADLARAFNVSHSTMWAVCKGEHW